MKKIIITGLTALLIGCGSEEMPTPDKWTEKYGIPVATNGIEIDLDRLDNKYEGTTMCLGYGQVDFIVEVMSSLTYFNCGDASETGRCAGLYWRDKSLIQIPSKHNAFAHELTHHLTGKEDNNYDANSPMSICGDKVDGEYNAGE